MLKSMRNLQSIFDRLPFTMQRNVFVNWRAVFRLSVIAVIVILIFLSFRLSKNLHFSKEINPKIDWNDYEMTRVDSLRTGFGEQGKGEELENKKEIEENSELFKVFGMSVLISDKISLSRSTPDFRHPDCLSLKYFSSLPR